MTRTDPKHTTYCMKHERLEAIKSVIHAAPFQVYEGALKTERHGYEVRAVTTTKCKVFFIGGPRWIQ